MPKRGGKIGFRVSIMTSAIFVASVCFVVLAVGTAFVLVNSVERDSDGELLARGQKYASAFSTKLDNALHYLSVTAGIIEEQVNSGTADRKRLRETLQVMFERNGRIDKTGVMLEANAYDGKDADYAGTQLGASRSGRINFNFFSVNGSTVYLPEMPEGDAVFDSDFYMQASQTGTPVYTNPTIYKINGVDVHMFTVAYPMRDVNGVFLGVVTVDVFLNEFYEQLQAEKIYETGYAVVFSDSGKVMYSPAYRDVGRDKDATSVDYITPPRSEAVIFSAVASRINGKRSKAVTVAVDTPAFGGRFYFSVVAPVIEIYAAGIRTAAALLGFCAATIIFAFSYLVKYIVNPIKKVTENAFLVGYGYLSAETVFEGADEILAPKNEILNLHIALKSMLSELSELNRLEYESRILKHGKERAEESLRAKNLFLEQMSHEIRTPMNTIVGMAELILREDLPHGTSEKAVMIKRAGDNLLSAISSIIDLSKIESGKLEIVTRKYLIVTIINDVINAGRGKIAEADVAFTVNVDSNVPKELIGDDVRIRQILLNLLNNACKYCTKGHISVDIGCDITGENSIILNMSVTDTGVGIAPDRLNKLIGDFTQANKADGGLGGLGLTIVKNLCRIMDGKISADSVLGEGSTFTAEIPQTFESYEKIAVVENPAKKSVLLYEPRTAYAASIARTVESLGVMCKTVERRAEFLENISRRDYPFIFISSPLLDGAKETLRKLGKKASLIALAGFKPDAGANTLLMPVSVTSVANVLNDADSAAVHSARKKSGIRFTAPDARVLIADDILTNLRVAEGLMSPYNMQIDTCKDGAEAVELVSSRQYDLVFMDHMMPVMDGVEATKAIRALDGECYRSLPIIALTANAVYGVKEMFLSNGFSDYMPKPIEMARLNEVLSVWVPVDKQIKNSIADSADNSGENSDSGTGGFEIDGVDVPYGMSMTGGTLEKYIKTLKVFCGDCEEKLSLMDGALESGDINLYTTCVHALKSAAAVLGISHISKSAAMLEIAGKGGDTAYIEAQNSEFVDELTSLTERITAAISSAALTSGTAQSKDSDMDFFRTEGIKLIKALEDMDIQRINRILASLKERHLHNGVSDALEIVAQKILVCEYDDALTVLNVIINRGD